jgi:signal transduction histidine kinase
MNREEAARLLLERDSRARLRAARWFSKHAQESDHDFLRRAIELGGDRWTQDALQAALANLHRLQPGVTQRRHEDDNEVGEGLTEEIYSEAVEETTAQLVHELEPVLGTLKVLARKEIPDYENSQTFHQILRLERVLGAIDTLRRAASPPSVVELDLAEVIRRLSDTEQRSSRPGLEIAFGGPRPFIVLGDQALIELAFTNGIRNALESTAAVDVEDTPPVVVTWGDTNREYWVAILDEGLGIPAGRTSSVFEIGITSKRDHLGMGLALAKQAVTSLRGEVSLTPRTPRGAAYRFSWPKATAR